MKKKLMLLVVSLLLMLLSVSQDTLNPIQLIVNKGDTCAIVPVSRIKRANVKIVKYDACLEENTEYQKLTVTLKDQVIDLTTDLNYHKKLVGEKDTQVSTLQNSLSLKDQQIALKDDEKKALKKKNTKLTIGVIAEGVLIIIFTGVALFGG